MALSGDLKDFALLQLLTLVQITSKGGALTLQRGREKAVIHFENGQLTKVVPPDSRQESMATALFRAGRIDRELYELVSSQSLPSEKAVGLLVVDQGAMSQDELVEFVRQKALAQLFLLLTWGDGTFRFDVDAASPEDDILAPTDLGPVLEKGRAYLEEWKVLVSQIPDLDKPVTLIMEPQRQIEEVCLSLTEWKMVAAIPGSATLREVAEKLDLDEFAVRKLAYSLISAGLMDVVQTELVPPKSEKAALAESLRELTSAATPSEPEPESPALPPIMQEPEQPRGGAFSRLFGRK